MKAPAWRPPSASLAISCLALFVALSGTALALSNGEVRSRHIADNAVKTKHVAGGAIKAPTLADGAVTAAKLAEGVVGRDKLANSAVDGAKIEQGSLEAIHFGPGELPGETTSASAQENHVGGEPEPITLGHHTTVLSLDDPEGTGSITVPGPSRLTAHATATVHNTGSFGVLECRLAIFQLPGGGQLPFGQAGLESVGNQALRTIPTAGAVSLDAGTYDVELQCITYQETDGHFDYLKGNIVAVAVPR